MLVLEPIRKKETRKRKLKKREIAMVRLGCEIRHKNQMASEGPEGRQYCTETRA